MNYCYYCEQLVNRMPYDGKQHWHDNCKQKMRQTNLTTKQLTTNLADYWSKPPAEQQKAREEVVPSTPPSRCIVILDESKPESEAR